MNFQKGGHIPPAFRNRPALRLGLAVLSLLLPGTQRSPAPVLPTILVAISVTNGMTSFSSLGNQSAASGALIFQVAK